MSSKVEQFKNKMRNVFECIFAIFFFGIASYLFYGLLAGIARIVINFSQSEFIVRGGTVLGYLGSSALILICVYILHRKETKE